jgi:predicted protein tyrosine phosphatase
LESILDIDVRSRKWAKEFKCSVPWAAISVSTERGDFPVLSEENRVGLLRLCFWDIANPRLGQEDALDGKLFSKEQARQVLDFVEEVWDKVKVMLIHCEAGISRSPAIAAAITNIKFGQGEEMPFFNRYTPNSHVYRTILNEYYGGDSRMMAFANKLVSDKAYGEILDEPWDCTK